MSGVAVVVGTLDLYKDVWPGLCHGLKKYWPHCPWSIKFITNKLDAPCGETIKVGGDHTNWGGRMLRGLKRIKEPVILWMISDHWITAPPDVIAMMVFADLISEGKADRIRLYPGWDHDKSAGVSPYDSRLLIFTQDSPYRTSCKPSLWKRQTFLDLLRDDEQPWDFERQGQKRSRKYGDRFLAVKDWGIWSFVTRDDPTGPWDKSPVVKGKWSTAAKRYCEMEGLDIDLSKHPVKGNPFGKEIPKWILP